MFNIFSEMNWIAIAIAAVVSFMLGGLWFTQFFGKVYVVALGRENEPPKPLAPIFVAGPFVCSLIMTITSEILVQAFKIKSVSDGLLFGVIIGLGYLASTTVNTAINPNMPRPLLYGLISGSYFFLAGVIVSVILVVMG